MYIGFNVYNFKSEDVFPEFISKLGNNDVPSANKVCEHNLYLLSV